MTGNLSLLPDSLLCLMTNIVAPEALEFGLVDSILERRPQGTGLGVGAGEAAAAEKDKEGPRDA